MYMCTILLMKIGKAASITVMFNPFLTSGHVHFHHLDQSPAQHCLRMSPNRVFSLNP